MLYSRGDETSKNNNSPDEEDEPAWKKNEDVKVI